MVKLQSVLSHSREIVKLETNLMSERTSAQAELARLTRFVSGYEPYSNKLEEAKQILNEIDTQSNKIEVPTLRAEHFSDQIAHESLNTQLETVKQKLGHLTQSLSDSTRRIQSVKEELKKEVMDKHSMFTNIIENAQQKRLLDFREGGSLIEGLAKIQKESLWCIDSLNEKCTLSYIRESYMKYYEILCKKVADKLSEEKGVVWVSSVSKLHERGGNLRISDLIKLLLDDTEVKKLTSIANEKVLKKVIRELVDDGFLAESIMLW